GWVTQIDAIQQIFSFGPEGDFIPLFESECLLKSKLNLGEARTTQDIDSRVSIRVIRRRGEGVCVKPIVDGASAGRRSRIALRVDNVGTAGIEVVVHDLRGGDGERKPATQLHDA